MLTRRGLLGALPLAVGLTLFAQSGAALADQAAKAFLEKIYATYKGKNSKGVRLGSDTALRLYFEPALAALMIKNRRDAARSGEVPEFDGDPFLDAQDWEIGTVATTVEDTAPDRASATAKFENFKMPTTVAYDLVKLKPGWRIADITWQRDDGTTDTLRGLYVKK